ncbi:hypothetical protein [Brevibacillus sp. NRS-1366]|uniref:hypothetical protein n=1 Tax=Brevibacillus sp. NRS-1366 TaxID=3233899 RepID=UPI003D24D403
MKIKLMPSLLAFLILFTATNNGNAVAAKEAPQVIMLFVEGMSFSDMEKFGQDPLVDKWIAQSSAGAVSIRTPGARTAPNGYLLLGSGGQALYSVKSGTAYHPAESFSLRETAGERARELGAAEEKGSRSSIIFPGIFRLLAENRDKPFSSRIGLLGTTLAANEIRVAAYGNGDFDDTKQRHSILFAMDEEGRVPYGDISGNSLLSSPGYPYGVKTNYSYLLHQIRGDQDSGLITVQLSDLSRLYQLADDMEPDQFARQYVRVLTDLSSFLNDLLKGRKTNQLIMLVSPAVSAKATKDKALLSPILVWKNKEKGLLTSATTRQSGLISGVDILPTILSWLDVPVPKGLVGHVMRVEKEREMTQLLDQVDRSHHTYATRPAVLYTYVMLQIITLACAALLWLWGKKRSGSGLVRLRRGVRLALLALLWFPVLLLGEGLLGWKASGHVVLGVLITIALLAAFMLEHLSLAYTTLIVSGVTALAIVTDGWTGATLMRHSYLGYDPVIGARFYGLGNEYEGVLIGSAILFVASLYQVSSSYHFQASGHRSALVPFIASALFGTVLYYMVAPSLGTDAGGFLAGLVGFSVAFARLQGWRIGKKGLLLMAGGLMIGVAVLIAGSLLTDQPLTHVGRVSQQIVMGDWAEVGKMVERKLAMNVRLIRVSMWSRVFVVSLVVLGLMALKNDRFFRSLAEGTPFLVKGFAGVIAGSLAGLVLNDSGIVTAATCIIFLVVPALYAALEEPAQERCST